MFKPGKRPYYVIYYMSSGDGNSMGVYLVSRNKKEAIRFFRWLYTDGAARDWENEEGEFYGERNITITEDPNDPTEVKGNFYFNDEEYGFDVELKTVRVDVPWGWRGPNTDLLSRYNNFIERERR